MRRAHVWRYDATETHRPWLVTGPGGWDEPPAFQTWAAAVAYADAYVNGREDQWFGYQPTKGEDR
jgi:hypothetical protein